MFGALRNNLTALASLRPEEKTRYIDVNTSREGCSALNGFASYGHLLMIGFVYVRGMGILSGEASLSFLLSPPFSIGTSAVRKVFVLLGGLL